ncbi:MAG: hypothetical protein ABIN58_05870 [candidate division WOR-3 bacterium]
MVVLHTNRRGKTFYLHQGTTKTGKPKYFFSLNNKGELAHGVPKGFEIYENPNGQVFLHRKEAKLITDEELAVVEEGLKRYSRQQRCWVDVRQAIITVFTPDQNWAELEEGMELLAGLKARRVFDRFTSYSPVLQFVLADKEQRTFITRRYCFLGSVDDWIEIGRPGRLATLVKKYVRHLGQDSFYDLH